MKKQHYNKKYFEDRDYLDLRMAESIIDFMQKHKLKKILDVGCGTGRYVKFFNDKGFPTVGIDYADDAIKIARKITKNKVRKASAIKLPFKKGTFDLVLSIS